MDTAENIFDQQMTVGGSRQTKRRESKINEFSNSQENKGKSKHVTTACLNCRKRKIKCDTGEPSCSNCQLYTQVCTYPRGVDRRKVPSKERIVALEAYIRTLESLLDDHGIALPQTPESTYSNNRDRQGGEATISSSSIAAIAVEPQGALSSIDPFLAKFGNQSSPSVGIEDFNLGLTKSYSADLAGPKYDYEGVFPGVDNLTAGNDGSSPLMDQLAGRMGSLQIAGDGQLRFFGATSNLHILLNGTRQPPSPWSYLKQDNKTTLQSAGVGQAVDPELEEHLLRLYFAWEDPSIHVLDQEIFYRERERCKSTGGLSDIYSETLTNAMCAVGAALTPRHCIELPEPMVEFFAARAKALLEVEMDSPKLSTVSSLVIISGVEALLTRDPRGWIYSGMAMRVATDLGLHLDTSAYVTAGIIDIEEAALRNTIFWGAFIHERMWSLYMGRPESLDDKTITAPPPSLMASTLSKGAFWVPYVDDHDQSAFPPLPSQLNEVHSYNLSLCAKMTRIRETIYPDSISFTRRPEDLFDAVSSLQSELLSWYSGLPESLSVDEFSMTGFYLPHVIQLHMQYHCLMILANRPFFSKNHGYQSRRVMETSVGHSACTQAATSIVRLLKIYRRLYTFRRINIQAVHLIFTASLVHVCNACGSSKPQVKSAAWGGLEVCFQALAEIGEGYRNATRSLDVVKSIKSELLNWSRAKIKRNNVTDGDSENIEETSKRRCLSDGPGTGEAKRPAGNEPIDTEDSTTSFLDFESIPWANFSAGTVSSLDAFFWPDFSKTELRPFDS